MHLRNNLYLLVCVLTVFSGIGRIAASPDGKDEEDTVNTELLFEEAKIRADQRDRLGAELEKVVADENASPGDRVRAARLLGRLQYLPAIPTMIRYADVRPLVAGTSRASVGMALSDYGEAAVPQIVEACLKEDLIVIRGGTKSGRSVGHFYREIRDGSTFRSARLYARGIAASHRDDPEIQVKVGVFLAQLDKYDKD